MSTPILAFDFGGTKLAAAVVDLDNGKLRAHIRKPTPVGKGAEASLEAIISAGHDALQSCQLDTQSVNGIGVSFGGPVSDDRKTVIRSLHIQEWDQFDLPEQLSKIFKQPAYMDNDGNAAALGEWHYGVGKGAVNMLYVQASTGIGSGLIINNQLYRGCGMAGEFGHMTVLPDGPLCVCGKHGCVESISSGWAIARDAKNTMVNLKKNLPLNVYNRDNPEEINAKFVVSAYREGDARAKVIIERAFTLLGLSIANAISLIDPEIVVIGGGITKAQDVMLEFLAPALDKYIPPMFKGRYRLAFSELNGFETLLGAALLTKGY